MLISNTNVTFKYECYLFCNKRHAIALRKKVFLKISQNSQENTCVGISFLIKACNFIKKEAPTLAFSSEFCEIFENTFSTEYIRVTNSI